MLVGGLYTRWFHRWALVPGWLAGMIAGTLAAYNTATPTTSHWASSSDILFGFTIYIGISAFILNLAIAVIVTLVLRAFRVPEGPDETRPHDFTADPATQEDSSSLRPPETLHRVSPLHHAASSSKGTHQSAIPLT